jgi:hypothetical protein
MTFAGLQARALRPRAIADQLELRKFVPAFTFCIFNFFYFASHPSWRIPETSRGVKTAFTLLTLQMSYLNKSGCSQISSINQIQASVTGCVAQTLAYDSVILPGMADVSLCPTQVPQSRMSRGRCSVPAEQTQTNTDTDTLRQSHMCSVPANFQDLLPQLHTDSNELPEQQSRQMWESMKPSTIASFSCPCAQCFSDADGNIRDACITFYFLPLTFIPPARPTCAPPTALFEYAVYFALDP